MSMTQAASDTTPTAIEADRAKAGESADRPSARDYLRAFPQYLWPQHLFSAVLFRATRIRYPAIKDRQIRWAIRRFGVDMSLAAEPDPVRYATFNAFFTRRLHADARPIAQAPDAVVSPVDGVVSQAGDIEAERLIQAKGRYFSLGALLGHDPRHYAPFAGGRFATLYLSPKDYHRIHMPVAGRLRSMVYVPGRLFSVDAATTRVVDGLFARNERVVALFETEWGALAMVLVGAVGVGSIETVWAGSVTPARPRRPRTWLYEGEDAPMLGRGEEMGRFNMGSTVIVLLPAGAASWEPGLMPGATVEMGQCIGRLPSLNPERPPWPSPPT